MDYDYRMECLSHLHPDIAEMTLLPGIKREYSLYDVAVMTRAAPAKLLGQSDRGHLKPGAKADVAVYRDQHDKAAMFRRAERVFKNGELVVEKGMIHSRPEGQTLAVELGYDRQIESHIQQYFDRYYSFRLSNYGVNEADIKPGRPTFRMHKVAGEFSI